MPSPRHSRRRLLRYAGALAAGAMAGTARTLHAQELPELIRVIVPLATGASLDARARVIAEAMTRRLKQRVIVENRPGAGQTMGAIFVARSKPDGGTLLFTNNAHVIGPHLIRDASYDPLRDLAAVTRAYDSGLVLVAHPSLGASTVKELVAAAKRSAAPLGYASSGNGSVPHLAMEMFARMAGLRMVHVPYKADAQALIDVIGGQIPMMISGYVAALPQVKSGRLRALAVTGTKRVSIFPEVPTLAESGYPDYVLNAWGGFFAPAKTPAPVIARLNREITAAVMLPLVAEHLDATGAIPAAPSPEEFTGFVTKEWERYGKIVRELGLSLE